MPITKSNEFEEIANRLRDVSREVLDLANELVAIRSYYTANEQATSWAAWLSKDELGNSGVTKEQLVSMMTFSDHLGQFLDNKAVSTGDRRTILNQVRSTD